MQFFKTISKHVTSDEELVSKFRKGRDLAVLGELYQRYMDLVFAVALKYLGDPEAAKDAVMAIFEELASKLHKYDISHFKGWLFTLAKNYCLMQLRSSGRLPTKPLDDLVHSADYEHLDIDHEKEHRLNQLTECLSALPPQQRKAVELFYFQGRCYKEIASTTGLEWNKIRSLIQNGKRNLKLCIEKKT